MTAIAGGFTGMARLLFSFIYWQTAVYARQRIDHVITREMNRLRTLPVAEIRDGLQVWIIQGLHGVRCAGLLASGSAHLAGNLLNAPDIS